MTSVGSPSLAAPALGDNLLPALLQSRVVPRDSLTLGAELGKGAFGIVYRGLLRRSAGKALAVAGCQSA
jgi:hypothetical protein